MDLGMLFRNDGGAGVRGPANSNHFALRAWPMEDLYFHRKEISNARLVREEDPRELTKDWTAVGAATAVTMLFLTAMAPTVGNMLADYQITALDKEKARLENELRMTEIELANKRSTERLHQLNEENGIGLVPPGPDQVIRLADDEAVALNVEKRVKKP